MNLRNLLLIISIGLVLAAVVLMVGRTQPTPVADLRNESIPASSEHAHSSAARVPAFQLVSNETQLAPTLEPAQFVGKARSAYVVAQKIPRTLAQLPCYCHCDKGFGHKSLHSCFVDEHASQCAVCVDEALLAYELETEKKMTPEQVRKVIIDKYSTE